VSSRRVLVPAVLAAGALLVRRFGRRSGVTTDEAHAALPGDDLVPAPMWESTRAVTIAAPPAAVWPWIVQMGFPAQRAGWYTPHVLDRIQWGIEERSKRAAALGRASRSRRAAASYGS
jgi:hypothetical protein